MNGIFSRTFSFVPQPSSYSLIRKVKQMKSLIEAKKELFLSKIPMNLRMASLSPYEQIMFAAIIVFFLTVKFLCTSNSI